MALRYNFTVTIFTPSKKSGATQAAKNGQVLQVITHIPNVTADLPNRITVLKKTNSLPVTEDPEPAITPAEVASLRSLGLPPMSLEVLQQPLAERIQQAMTDLEVDESMSDHQLYRYYRLLPGDLTEAYASNDLVQPIHGRRSLEIPVTFLSPSRRIARLDSHVLAHRAGTKELRHLLDVPTSKGQWHVEPRGAHSTLAPDAFWETAQGKTAIEYDSGTYAATTIQKKIQKFRELDARHIVWGVPSSSRLLNLNEKFSLDLRLCEWWKNDNQGG